MNRRQQFAAQYLRMSTDLQNLSIGLQKQAIAKFANDSGLQIVRTYEDAGKSGMTIRQREAMKQLVRDVTDPHCPFGTVLVYDVSRWGRFQDTDASAYWEYHCQIHGVRVIYVAESFSQQAGPLGAVVKSLKRAMAAEYSRELAIKVRAGQQRVISLGYSVGGQPAIGLVRQVFTRDGQPRMVLRAGERKAVQSDRIKLVPGPPEQVTLLRRIFELYAFTNTSITSLVRTLNLEGHVTNKGRAFTRRSIEGLLRFEPFIGNYVWAKRVNTAQGVKPNREADMVRANSTIEPLIDKDLWQAVQDKLRLHAKPKRSPQLMLESLQQALALKPDMTACDLASLGCAPSQTYLKAFGSMQAAYAMAGRENFEKVYGWSRQRAEKTKTKTREILAALSQACIRLWIWPECNYQSHVLSLPDGCRIQVYLSWRRSFTKEPAWLIPRIRRCASDWRLILLMDDQGNIKHFYMLPDELRSQLPMLVRSRELDLDVFTRHRIYSYTEAITRSLA